jgi:hypothetical protein
MLSFPSSFVFTRGLLAYVHLSSISFPIDSTRGWPDGRGESTRATILACVCERGIKSRDRHMGLGVMIHRPVAREKEKIVRSKPRQPASHATRHASPQE